MNQNWMDDPQLAQIDKSKLFLLQQLADQGKGKTMTEMLPYLMGIMETGRKRGASFSKEETELLLGVLKKGKSSAELARLEKIISLLQNMHR